MPRIICTGRRIRSTIRRMWAKESLYNILIMDESQSIFGAGCGASTKLVEPCGRITRIHNYKFPYEYIRQFDQLMQKKEQVREICERIREQEAEK